MINASTSAVMIMSSSLTKSIPNANNLKNIMNKTKTKKLLSHDEHGDSCGNHNVVFIHMN